MKIKKRYRLFLRGSSFYLEDTLARKQSSLGTKDRKDAERILHAKNEVEQVTAINLQIAQAYLAAGDEGFSTRTWTFVMEEMAKLKSGSTLERWKHAMRHSAFDLIREMPLVPTRSKHILRVLQMGTISTNMFLRRLHNFAADVGWLLRPVLPRKRCWPPLRLPLGRLAGARPSQADRCFSVCQWYPSSVPVSPTTCSRV